MKKSEKQRISETATSVRLREADLKELDRIRKKIDPEMTRSQFLRKLVKKAIEEYVQREEFEREMS